MTTATASWDLDTLVGSLARQGWGPLADEKRGVARTLRALADVLPHGSAEGRTTAVQLGQVAGITERWIRFGLTVLEKLGVIEWHRGRRGVPSIIRVCKRVLAAWVRCAKAARRAPRPGGRPVQPTRPAGPGRPRSPRGSRFQPEVRSGLYPFREVTPGRAVTRPPITAHRTGVTMVWTPPRQAQQDDGGPVTLDTLDLPPLTDGWEYVDFCQVCGRTCAQCHTITSKLPAHLGHRFEPTRRRTPRMPNA